MASQSTSSTRRSRASSRRNDEDERKSNSSLSSQRSATVIKLRAEGDVHSASGRFDSCAFIVHCVEHKTILVNRREDSAWMPFTQLPPNRSWVESALYGLFVVLHSSDQDKFAHYKANPPYQSFKCLQVLRVQMPQTQKFITRLIYYFEMKPSNECCQPISNHLEWLSLEQIKQGKMCMWGPELVEYCNRISQPETLVTEYGLDEAFLHVPRDPPGSEQEKILKSLHITEKVVERMYAHFLEHVYPSLYQCWDSFKSYMIKCTLETDHNRLTKLFDAFDYTNNGYLSFHEFLLGLACIEPSMEHSQFRAKFLFRYYNTDKSGTLSKEELRSLVADLNPDELTVDDAKLAETIRAFNTEPNSHDCQITQKDFITAIETNKLVGTAALCRSSKSTFMQITRNIAKDKLCQSGRNQDHHKKVFQAFSSVQLKRTKVDDSICLNCVSREYELASHLVHFHHDQSMTSQRIATVVKPTEERLVPQFNYSKEWTFNVASDANVILNLIRKFNHYKNNPIYDKEPMGLMQHDSEELVCYVQQLYLQMKQLLQAESKCHRVYSPCYVMGDIHGNLADLLSMEKVLWSEMPCVSANYLFLGDYVDRGRWSLECALYLVCFKILCPTKVTLLRGNHEVRSLQERYTYLKELRYKYGPKNGQRLFDYTNEIFDRLPVCALIDDTIYCAHGGIPHTLERIEQIEQLPNVVKDPEMESSAIWDILWSDPANEPEFANVADKMFIDPLKAGGFVPNLKRRAGSLFNEEGATKFLKLNNLTHIVRAHEAIELGYHFHFDTKCLTVFSCSHYCGNANICACILVEGGKIRVIQVDTVNNDSATDDFEFP